MHSITFVFKVTITITNIVLCLPLICTTLSYCILHHRNIFLSPLSRFGMFLCARYSIYSFTFIYIKLDVPIDQCVFVAIIAVITLNIDFDPYGFVVHSKTYTQNQYTDIECQKQHKISNVESQYTLWTKKNDSKSIIRFSKWQKNIF